MKAQQSNDNNFIKQGAILAVASIISRIIGLLYRSPMTAIIGDEANGLYGYAFEIYSFALILSSYSMPLAVSKLLSGKFAKKEYRNGYTIFKYAFVFSAVAGALMMIILLALSNALERFTGYDGLAIPLRVLAPTIFVVSVLGTVRGFFQSRKTMIPTAFSQIIEQVFNAIISILAAWIMVRCSNPQNHDGMGAAGGTMGTLFGSISALAFVGFLYFAYKPRMAKHLMHDRSRSKDSPSDIMKMLFITIIPIILSQAVYQASGIIDGTMWGRLYTGADMKTLQSVYSKYRTLINIPNAISSSMASSMIPTLVSLWTLGNIRDFRAKLATAVKTNMIIAFPCAIGLSVLGTPIMRTLFPTTDFIISGRMLLFGGIAVVFYALSTIINAALQGLDKMNIPVIHAAISLALHIPLVWALLKFTNMGIYVLLIGAVTYPLVVCILNWFAVAKHANYRQEVKNTFLIPLLASIIMGAAAFGIYKLIVLILGISYAANLVAVAISILLAIIIYFVLIILLKGLTVKDMADFPMGMRIYRLARKCHLMK